MSGIGHPCEVCPQPGRQARGSSYDRKYNRVHWYCREHHPWLGGMLLEGRTPGSSVAFAHPPLLPREAVTRTGHLGARPGGI